MSVPPSLRVTQGGLSILIRDLAYSVGRTTENRPSQNQSGKKPIEGRESS